MDNSTAENVKGPGWAVELPEKLPEMVYGMVGGRGQRPPGLYELLLAHPDKRSEISDRLVQQIGDKRAFPLLAEAETEAERTTGIDNARRDVFLALAEIRNQAMTAVAALGRLERLGDIEVTESADVPYVRSFLEDVRKAGAAGAALWPFDASGDLR